MPQPPGEIPQALAERLAGYSWSAQSIGCSNAAVFRLEQPGRPTLFVKTEPTSAFSELPDEARRLRWLARQGVACPEITAELRQGGGDWLLMSAVPGRDLASSPELPARRITEIAADALRHLHGLPIAACPFDESLEAKIAQARARMEAGLVDEADFDAQRKGRPAAKLFAELIARRPASEDLVVCHGDASLPNLLAADGRFTGFIDCGRAGVADRYQDIALACWSIRYNLGEPWVAPFLKRYGIEPDPARMDYFLLLDEFF